MSRTIRKQLFQILESLQQVNRGIEKLLITNRVSDIMRALEDCQSCAIAIGNQIEAVYGEGTQSVKHLEEYCETIFQLSQNLPEAEARRNLYMISTQQLEWIKQSMEQDIPDKLEVVFLPYKASMWDSLESVWMAARDDEECDAYVIPIPYYDKNPDGSFREEHWEGDEYPKYVSITRYDAYNFEQRKPDMIYIHNPYDDGNYVTSVHPFFYSKNLKQFTEKLVYIPYFVLNEANPEYENAIKEMEHFCMTAGVMNADKVIVQSQVMKHMYVHVMTQYMGGNTKAYWENKILALGSPKIDKVHNTKKEDLEIPEEWLKVIQKPDGSWKKIFFYNISITALLLYNEKLFQKMKKVFDIFEERKDDIAFLWRPHPLIWTTIQSMRPNLLEEYQKTVEEYKTAGWGIYDDTPDVNRAVGISDAYYGEMSSLIPLFGEVKKPVLVQSPLILSAEQADNYQRVTRYQLENEAYSLEEYIEESIVKIDLFTSQKKEILIGSSIYNEMKQ